jgi:hypothetical protein
MVQFRVKGGVKLALLVGSTSSTLCRPYFPDEIFYVYFHSETGNCYIFANEKCVKKTNSMTFWKTVI